MTIRCWGQGPTGRAHAQLRPHLFGQRWRSHQQRYPESCLLPRRDSDRRLRLGKSRGGYWSRLLRGSRPRPNTGFRAFARLTILKAGQLFGQDGLEQRALREAWSTVGIEVSDRRASRSGPPKHHLSPPCAIDRAEHASGDTGEDAEPALRGAALSRSRPRPDDVVSERSRPTAIADIKYRAAQLRDEVAARRQMYLEDVWAFTRSQVRALGVLMDDLVRMQDGLLQGLRQELRTAPSTDAFAHMYNTVLAQIGASREVLQFFWSLFDQRRDPHLAPQLDAADRVIADCYRTCLDRLSQWGAIGYDPDLAPPWSGSVLAPQSPHGALRYQSSSLAQCRVIDDYRFRLSPSLRTMPAVCGCIARSTMKWPTRS